MTDAIVKTVIIGLMVLEYSALGVLVWLWWFR